jgi:hypothetical protein
MREALDALGTELAFDAGVGFGADALSEPQPGRIIERLAEWVEAPNRIQEWVTFCVRRRLVRDAGLQPLTDRLDNGRVSPEKAVGVFRHCYFETLMRRA